MELNDKQLVMKQALDDCLAGKKTTREVAVELGYTQRAIQIRKKQYIQNGDASLVHGNKGKKCPKPGYSEKAVRLAEIFNQVNNFGIREFETVTYTNFAEIANEEFNIRCSVSWVARILKKLGHVSTWCCMRKKGEHVHPYRPRKEHLGELVQIDGTPFDWFGDGHQRCIQAAVDDATGEVVGAYMTENECLLGYLEVFRQMFVNYGVPVALYPDRTRLIFKEVEETDEHGRSVHVERPETQLGKIITSFGIDVFPAHSPQAKGRVERFWRTLQSRLPVQFRMHNIRTVEEANKFLQDVYIPKFNKRFAHLPKSEESMYVAASREQICSLLKASFTGCTDNAGVVSLKGYRFYVPGFIRKKVVLCLSERDGIWAETPGDWKCTKYPVQLCETDTTGPLPEVYKTLIEKVFLQNAKPRFREVYYEPGTVLDNVKQKVS
ncbi:MAG: ISNCY family transposase [Treponema sp.]|nr:ISNCY family transposase [Treponema sp.]